MGLKEVPFPCRCSADAAAEQGRPLGHGCVQVGWSAGEVKESQILPVWLLAAPHRAGDGSLLPTRGCEMPNYSSHTPVQMGHTCVIK